MGGVSRVQMCGVGPPVIQHWLILTSPPGCGMYVDQTLQSLFNACSIICIVYMYCTYLHVYGQMVEYLPRKKNSCSIYPN